MATQVISDGTAADNQRSINGWHPWLRARWLDEMRRTPGAAAPDYLDYDATGSPQVLTTSSGAEVFYDLDGQGSPVNLVKTTGVLAGSYAYDPYGAYTDTNIDGGSATGENPFRYAGAAGAYDRGTGFIKDGNRYYNPTIGRFSQEDTITTLADPGKANLYAYAGDDPINNVDPTGASASPSKMSG
jgi:RHS repeat-associated protein